jgi:hypothetical protein
MNNKKTETDSPDYNKPVAYDVDGRPLYAHPYESDSQSKIVHVARPITPEQPVISEDVKLKHERSKQMFPDLNLSEGEYVISFVRRHPIGLISPIMVGVVLIFITLVLMFNFSSIIGSLQMTSKPIDSSAIILPSIAFIILVLVGMYVVYTVYHNNRFFLTNESVIQEIQNSIFSKNEQTVSLINIEDASFTKVGIAQQLFDYGSIRLSTEGDETTYRFSYVSNPKEHIAILNNAIEAFKNGRPINED